MIVISYAREDEEFAQLLYQSMKNHGLDPWMDKPPAPYQADGLKPGARWRIEIPRRVRAAEYMVLVLSATSIRKVGYVQREFRLALEAMNEMPGDRIFAIPALREPCEVPDLEVGSVNLRDINWIPVYEIGVDEFVGRIQDLVVGGS